MNAVENAYESEIFDAQRFLEVVSHGPHSGLVCRHDLYPYLYLSRDPDESRVHCHGRRNGGPEYRDGRLSYPDESTSLAREISICCCYTSEIAYVVSGLEKENVKVSDAALRTSLAKALGTM